MEKLSVTLKGQLVIQLCNEPVMIQNTELIILPIDQEIE